MHIPHRAAALSPTTISPPCAAQIASEALLWLQPPVVSTLSALLSSIHKALSSHTLTDSKVTADPAQTAGTDDESPAAQSAADSPNGGQPADESAQRDGEVAGAAVAAWAAALGFLHAYLQAGGEVRASILCLITF